MIHIDGLCYQLSSSERVKRLQTDLQRELAELRNELEDNEMIRGATRTPSSVSLPKDVVFYTKEIEQALYRSLKVYEAHPIVIDAEIMQEEVENSLSSDYTPDSMPLILYQYFVNRTHELVQCKHMHLLRWKRFCEHTSTIEALYPLYQEKIKRIMSEYLDCVQRSQRLAIARESYINRNDNALLGVRVDDLLIYLRWLVCHLHSVKKFNQFMRILQWLPVVHKSQLIARKDEGRIEEFQLENIPSRYQKNTILGYDQTSHSRTGTSSIASTRSSPALDFTHQTVTFASSPNISNQSITSINYATDKDTFVLPKHISNFDDVKSLTNYLAHLYKIDMDILNISSIGQEVELYSVVCRKFNSVFKIQENMRIFRTYDLTDGVKDDGTDRDYTRAFKQESQWLPFISLKARKDPTQEKRMVQLRTRNNVDELLGAQSKFVQLNNPQRVLDTLKEHAHFGRTMPSHQPITSYKTDYSSFRVWKKIYLNPELNSKSV